ncbi:eukaryotic initiation factor-4E [Cryptosporidium sp. chipmunk genotype I]|uniref:eukaryotic initiation factor-4E n=1 Tax=Cryptosporidium sp. chipmunk genotype I TaxID=1280935 RepID=UPI00351A9EDA|nr:eukaryotic initiation factor-4E [Cryptosporidium sp. chipmunk genotype I]
MTEKEVVSKYLSFNESIEPSLTLPTACSEVDLPDDLISKPLPLSHEWVVWEQLNLETRKDSDYSNATKPVARFSSVQQFWWLWHHIPQPSELLKGKRMIRESSDGSKSVVDAVILFKEGIQPMWEDPMNAAGGHIHFRAWQSSVVPGELDTMWNNLVLAVIGGSLKNSSIVNGIRLVDKLGGSKGNIRIEIWFSDFSNQAAHQELLKEIETLMSSLLDGSSCDPPHLEVKSHSKNKPDAN